MTEQQDAAPTPAAFLVQVAPANATLGTRHLLQGQATVLGRDPACDVCEEAPGVAERHARVERRADGFYVVDLAGAAGHTSINGEPHLPARLLDGDLLHVGEAVYRFFESGGLEARFHEEIHQRVNVDFLTGAANRRHFLNRLERELRRGRRYGKPVAVIACDIDHFRTFNNNYGHECGDYVLRQLAGCVQKCLRDEALLGRFGGEEFAVLLPEADLDAGVRAAERVRAQVEQYPFEQHGVTYHVTLSLGVAVALPGEAELTPTGLLDQADQALFQAKRGGRNRVVPLPQTKPHATTAAAAPEAPAIAVARYDDLIRRGEDLAGAHLGRAGAFQALGNYAAALADYQEALARDPHCVAALLGRGRLLHGAGHWAEARACYTATLREDPRHAAALVLRGLTHFNVGDRANAEVDWHAALRAEPGNALAHFALGLAAYRQSQLAEAVAHFNRALAHDPCLADARFAKAYALFGLGDRPEWVDEADAAFATDCAPAFPGARFYSAPDVRLEASPAQDLPRACLIGVAPPRILGLRHDLVGEETLLGGGPRCEVWAGETDGPRASLLRQGAGHFLKNLGDAEQVLLNGTALTGSPLRSGDVLTVEQDRYLYLTSEPAPEKPFCDEAYRLQFIDPLTGLLASRYLTQALQRELRRAERGGYPVAVLFIDLDCFKAANLRLGADGANQVLKQAAHLLRESIAPGLAGRFRGDMFLMVLPGSDLEQAKRAAEAARETVAGHTFTYQEQNCTVTVSVGVSCTGPSEWTSHLELIRVADERLYQAKKLGRNRVIAG